MAISASVPDKIDRLSNLSDDLLLTIISFLPTRIAARTSLLSRRFQHLWEASPFLELITQDIPHPQSNNFVAMADRALLRRNPSLPLLSLHLDLSSLYFIRHGTAAASFASSLLSEARSLGLRHLIIGDLSASCFAPILPDIFSISTLNSLSLGFLPGLPFLEEVNVPSGINLTCLRSLSLRFFGAYQAKLNQLLSELHFLEDFHLDASIMHDLNLSSKTIRKLKLTIRPCTPELNTVGLFLPSLELLHLKLLANMSHINGEVPLLRKATIVLYELDVKDVSTVAELLNCISHVEELSMCIEESWHVTNPIPILFEPEKDMLDFPNLKHLDLTACFHEHNLEAVIRMLHHSPSLESLNLFHKVLEFTYGSNERRENVWASKLPCNANGNCHYAHFRNLQLVDNRKELMKWISKKCTSST